MLPLLPFTGIINCSYTSSVDLQALQIAKLHVVVLIFKRARKEDVNVSNCGSNPRLPSFTIFSEKN